MDATSCPTVWVDDGDGGKRLPRDRAFREGIVPGRSFRGISR
jgi:hypothetical protein